MHPQQDSVEVEMDWLAHLNQSLIARALGLTGLRGICRHLTRKKAKRSLALFSQSQLSYLRVCRREKKGEDIKPRLLSEAIKKNVNNRSPRAKDICGVRMGGCVPSTTFILFREEPRQRDNIYLAGEAMGGYMTAPVIPKSGRITQR